MSQDSFKNDPTSQWPAEVKDAYDHLKVPSLYDCVLTNEKLSFEVRKQNKDLKTMTESLQLLSAQLNSFMAMIEEEFIEYEEDEDEEDEGFPSEKQMLASVQMALIEHSKTEEAGREILMDSMDDLVDLSRMVKQLVSQLLSILPQQETSPSIPAWFSLAEGFMHSLIEQVDNVRYKAKSGLEKWHIQVIDPQLGEPFTNQKHRIVEHISGGKPGTIARVVRVGYRQDTSILRFADVIVYM